VNKIATFKLIFQSVLKVMRQVVTEWPTYRTELMNSIDSIDAELGSYVFSRG